MPEAKVKIAPRLTVSKPKRLESPDAPNYKASEVKVQLPDHDADVMLVLPNGEKIALQWRIELCSLDVCMEEGKNYPVTNWKGHNMEPSPTVQSFNHIRLAGQLVIDIGPHAIGESEEAD